ncbi:MAG: hypothetical protein JWN24_2964 [Phycisphaerales bacterium]|nr:hypothetical protein [Phycisphaerales bacterium]
MIGGASLAAAAVVGFFVWEALAVAYMNNFTVLSYAGDVFMVGAAWCIMGLFVRRFEPKIPPGHCLACGYDLTGNVSGTCPECGRKVG